MYHVTLALLLFWMAMTSGQRITIAAEQQESGAVTITVSSAKVAGYITEIRVVEPWIRTCGAAGTALRPVLDVRNALGGETVGSGLAGAWRIADAEETRVYTATITTAALRQQFLATSMATMTGTSNIAAAGAISGGSVGAVVCAVVYRPVAGQDGIIYDPADQATVTFSTAKAGTGVVPPVDVAAIIAAPVSVGADGRMRFVMTTRSTSTCVSEEPRGPNAPPVSHATVTGTTTAPTSVRSAFSSACDEVVHLGDGCDACVQHTAYVVTGQALEGTTRVVARFVEPITGARFSASFVVPESAKCTGAGCVVAVREVEAEATAVKDTVQANGDKKKSTPTSQRRGYVVAQVTLGKHAGRDETAETVVADVSSGKYSCVDIATPEGANVAAKIDKAVVSAVGMKPITLVENGEVTWNAARYSSTSVSQPDTGKTRLCFSLDLRVTDSDLNIDWSADAQKKLGKQQHQPENQDRYAGLHRVRHFPPPPPSDSSDEMPFWCEGICTGTLVIHLHDSEAIHDDGHGHRPLVGDDLHGYRSGTLVGSIFVGLMFLTLIGLLCLCVYRSVSDPEVHHLNKD